MGLTVCHSSAVELLRAARVDAGEEGLSLASCDIVAPSLRHGERWSAPHVSQIKSALGLLEGEPLDILVPDQAQRLRVPGVANHVWGTRGLGQGFLELPGSDIVIPCPAVLLAQMAEVLSLPELIALGHELCGGYTLRPEGSRSPALVGIRPVATEEELRQVYGQATRLRGRAALRHAMPRIRDGSLSPQETCLSTMFQMPVVTGGYQAGDVILNEALGRDPSRARLTSAECRAPDLLFRGTRVGLNYDGDVHLRLDGIVRAARALALEPGSPGLANALQVALESARGDAARDKRRDRDLLAMGYTVLPITKHDIRDIDALDLVARQVFALIEETTGRDMGSQTRALDDPDLRERRMAALDSLRRL